jgi:hypothetical protein
MSNRSIWQFFLGLGAVLAVLAFLVRLVKEVWYTPDDSILVKYSFEWAFLMVLAFLYVMRDKMEK